MPSICPPYSSASYMKMIGPFEVMVSTNSVLITTMNIVQNARQKWHFLCFKSFTECLRKNLNVCQHPSPFYMTSSSSLISWTIESSSWNKLSLGAISSMLSLSSTIRLYWEDYGEIVGDPNVSFIFIRYWDNCQIWKYNN